MTDLEKFTKLMDEFEVKYEKFISTEDNKSIIIRIAEETEDKKPLNDSNKVNGFNGFYMYYKFDENKKFKEIGIYE